VASRRQCERLIEAGRVAVNGRVVRDLPAFADPSRDSITVDDRPVGAGARHVYIMLNKPSRTLSTTHDEPGADRRTVLDLVDHPATPRLFPVGRLDYDTVGLVLLTNDGGLANRLTHPRFGVSKTYRAVVRGRLEDEQVQGLERGIYLADRDQGRTSGASRTARVGIRIIRRDRERTILQITLKEGRNRQVRRMLAQVGCPVRRLERIAMGPLRLTGLARGQWRLLERAELSALRRAVRKAGPGSGRSAGGDEPMEDPS